MDTQLINISFMNSLVVIFILTFFPKNRQNVPRDVFDDHVLRRASDAVPLRPFEVHLRHLPLPLPRELVVGPHLRRQLPHEKCL